MKTRIDYDKLSDELKILKAKITYPIEEAPIILFDFTPVSSAQDFTYNICSKIIKSAAKYNINNL